MSESPSSPSVRSRWPRSHVAVAAITATALAAALTAIPAAPAAAATSVAIKATAAQTSRSFWVADALGRNAATGTGPLAYYEKLLVTRYQNNPTLAPATAEAEIKKLRAAVSAAGTKALANESGDQKLPGLVALVHKTLAKGTWSTGLREAAGVTAQYFSGRTAVANPTGAEEVTGNSDFDPDDSVSNQLASGILGSVHDVAGNAAYPAFRTAQNAIFKGALAPTTDTAAQIVTSDPILAAIPSVTTLLTPSGGVSTNEAALQQLNDSVLQTVGAQESAAGHAVAAYTAQQTDVVASSNDAATRDAQQKAQKLQQDLEQAELSAATAGFSILASLVGLGDKQGAKVIQTIGAAAVQIATAVVKFADIAAEMGGVANAITSAAGAALTGNILAAGLSLISLFAGAQDPNAAILNQIAALQNQVAGLKQDMDERFDNVDKELGTIYDSMNYEFSQVNDQLRQISSGVADLQGEMIDVQRQLTNLEGGLWSSLSDGFRRPFWDSVDSALGYRDRTGQPLPDAQYLTADSAFYTWATIDSKDQASAGPTNRDYRESSIANELTAYPLDSDLNYLAELPTTWGLPALTSSSLPNPNDWVLGARAYLDLNLDYPQDAQGNKNLASEVSGIESGGDALQAFEAAISGGAATSYDGATVNPLFAKLLSRYDADFAAVGTDIGSTENAFMAQAAINPYGGLNQSLPRKRTYSDLTCPNQTSRAISSTTSDRFMPGALQIVQQYENATDGQGGNDTALCEGTSWIDPVVRSNSKVTTESETLLLTITSTWDGQPLFSQSIDVGRFVIWTQFENQPPVFSNIDVPTMISNNWASLEDQLTADTTVNVLNTSLAQQVHDAALAYLTTEQQKMFASVGSSFVTQPTATDLAQVTGIVDAIQDYLALGLPHTFAGDEELSSLLSSDQSVFTGSAIVAAYEQAAQSPPAAEPWSSLLATETSRSTALAASLGRDLAVIRAGYPDGSAATAATLQALSTLAPTVLTPSARFASATTVTVPTTKVGHRRTFVVTVTNPGLGRLKASKVTASGAGLHVASSTCASVPGHGSCKITVSYAPTHPATVSGAITLTTNTLRHTLAKSIKAKAVR